MKALSLTDRYEKYRDYCAKVDVAPMQYERWIIHTESLAGDSSQRLAIYEQSAIRRA